MPLLWRFSRAGSPSKASSNTLQGAPRRTGRNDRGVAADPASSSVDLRRHQRPEVSLGEASSAGALVLLGQRLRHRQSSGSAAAPGQSVIVKRFGRRPLPRLGRRAATGTRWSGSKFVLHNHASAAGVREVERLSISPSANSRARPRFGTSSSSSTQGQAAEIRSVCVRMITLVNGDCIAPPSVPSAAAAARCAGRPADSTVSWRQRPSALTAQAGAQLLRPSRRCRLAKLAGGAHSRHPDDHSPRARCPPARLIPGSPTLEALVHQLLAGSEKLVPARDQLAADCVPTSTPPANGLGSNPQWADRGAGSRKKG